MFALCTNKDVFFSQWCSRIWGEIDQQNQWYAWPKLGNRSKNYQDLVSSKKDGWVKVNVNPENVWDSRAKLRRIFHPQHRHLALQQMLLGNAHGDAIDTHQILDCFNIGLFQTIVLSFSWMMYWCHAILCTASKNARPRKLQSSRWKFWPTVWEEPGHCISNNDHWATVDGRNPAPVDRWFIPLFMGVQPSKVVQDFFHPQYHSEIQVMKCYEYVVMSIPGENIPSLVGARSPNWQQMIMKMCIGIY